jgi:hypothetical protein
MDATAANISALDQVGAVLRDVLDNYGVKPTTRREALLLTLGALYITSQIMDMPGCEHFIPARVLICANLAELTTLCEGYVGRDYFKVGVQ